MTEEQARAAGRRMGKTDLGQQMVEMGFNQALLLSTEERIEAAFRQWWCDTYAKDYPTRMFLKTGVSLGALSMGQIERRVRINLQREISA